MQDNSIPDSDIRASSTLAGATSLYAPRNARLHYTGGPGRLGGWIPAPDDTFTHYLQISFGRDTLVTGVATQGFHNANYYVKSYKLEYIDARGYIIHYYTKWHTRVNILANEFLIHHNIKYNRTTLFLCLDF